MRPAWVTLCAEVITVAEAGGVPAVRQVVLDTTDARALAEFYRALLGLRSSRGAAAGVRRPGRPPILHICGVKQ